MTGPGHKASFLALTALLAAVLLGAAYTLWFEDLEISAQVNTGTLDAGLICDEIAIPETAEAVAAANGTHEYNITVSGVAAGDTVQCSLTITNAGTVAWHLEGQVLTVLPPDIAPYTAVCAGYPGDCVGGGVWPEPLSGNSQPLFVSLDDMRGCQVHAGDSVEGSLFVGVNQSAVPDATYDIELTITVNQWNESEWDGCGDPRSSLLPFAAAERDA
jgi:hypothetical protein